MCHQLTSFDQNIILRHCPRFRIITLKRRRGCKMAEKQSFNINTDESNGSDKDKLVCHKGGCHCGRVRFEVQAPASLECIDCNCSICRKKQNIHFIVPEANFNLLEGEDHLTCYTFNTHKAKHLFCKTCGVQSFYKPRSNPDGYGIMPHCLDPENIQNITIQKFNGMNWEECMMQHGEQISKMSKT